MIGEFVCHDKKGGSEVIMHCQPGDSVFIRVFLISDFCLMLKGIEALFTQESGRFVLVGTATSYELAAEAMAQVQPDVVVLDIDLAPERVLPLITTFRAVSNAKILLLTRLDDTILQDKAVMFGARGVVDRDILPDVFFNAIEKVHQGEVWLDRSATGRIFVALSR
jgi:DNA-binding NarL/FixJ family response regulator